MESTTLQAQAISCEHCQHAIEEAVGALDGVHTVSVDIPAKSVNVSFDPMQVSLKRIEAAMDEEGYPVTKAES
jgi:copper chaperone